MNKTDIQSGGVVEYVKSNINPDEDTISAFFFGFLGMAYGAFVIGYTATPANMYIVATLLVSLFAFLFAAIRNR